MGYPLDSHTSRRRFVTLRRDLISLGPWWPRLPRPVRSPRPVPPRAPDARGMPVGGRCHYGARTISEAAGTDPRTYADGVLVGEAAGFLNAMRLKGVHPAQDGHAGRRDGPSRRSKPRTRAPRAWRHSSRRRARHT
jgi:electron-transferring-flavoprotein dehydrogenase